MPCVSHVEAFVREPGPSLVLFANHTITTTYGDGKSQNFVVYASYRHNRALMNKFRLVVVDALRNNNILDNKSSSMQDVQTLDFGVTKALVLQKTVAPMIQELERRRIGAYLNKVYGARNVADFRFRTEHPDLKIMPV